MGNWDEKDDPEEFTPDLDMIAEVFSQQEKDMEAKASTSDQKEAGGKDSKPSDDRGEEKTEAPGQNPEHSEEKTEVPQADPERSEGKTEASEPIPDEEDDFEEISLTSDDRPDEKSLEESAPESPDEDEVPEDPDGESSPESSKEDSAPAVTAEHRKSAEGKKASGKKKPSKDKKQPITPLELSRKKAARMLLAGCILWVGCILLVIVLVVMEHVSANRGEALPMNTEAETESAEVVYTWDTVEECEFSPHAVDSTQPSNMIESTGVVQNGNTLASVSDYVSSGEITFGLPDDYTQAEGVITFRGNNFRDDPTYGYAQITENTLTQKWSQEVGALSFGSHTWTGCGWTGQPLIVKWPKETKQIMNLYDWAKEDDDMVEVIYATMDGHVYFMDLNTGKYTRDSLNLGFTFKGAGALDPRGYPILYLGAGYSNDVAKSRAFIISLIDCSTLYTFGNEDPFSYRSNVSFFDSSALVDAETDTLIYPGENGVLYLIHLNTSYDEAAGTLTIDPETVKWHYWGKRSSSENYWVGMEDSAAIYKGYLFIADNGGHMMCLNLNTLELVWVQDILDDSNSTPVLSVEDGHLYVYVSTSFHLGWRSSDSAKVPIWKLDAETGEIVWQTDYTCWSDEGVSGGVQSTIAVGKGDMADNIYVTVSKTDYNAHGCLASLNKATGEINWENTTYYAWSSPVCVYNEDGSGRVVYCTCDGKLRMVDGATGEEYAQTALSDGSIEASPAVYDNMLVVGTRAGKIWGVELD